jgi:hypothetical protein
MMRILTLEEIERRFEQVYLLPSTIKENKVPLHIIEKYKHKLKHNHWLAISEYQVLTEEFMEKYKMCIDWYYACKTQTISEEFAERNQHLIHLSIFFEYQHCTPSFALKHIDKMFVDTMKRNKKINHDEFTHIYQMLERKRENTWKFKVEDEKREERRNKEKAIKKETITINLTTAKCSCCRSPFEFFEEIVVGNADEIFCTEECLVKYYKKSNQIVNVII